MSERKSFGADAGVPMYLQYAMIAVLIAVVIIGSIYSEKRLSEARASANTEASTPASDN